MVLKNTIFFWYYEIFSHIINIVNIVGFLYINIIEILI